LIQGTGNQSFAQGAIQVGTPGAGKVLVIISDGQTELDVFSNTILATGAFYYVSVTWNGNSVGVFVNGILDTQTDPVSINLGPSAYPYQIGGIQNGQLYFGGVIDELQIWGHALTAAEISGIASAAASGQCSTLWYSEENPNKVGRINRDGSAVTGFPITLTAPAMPYGLTLGPDGNVWVAEYGTGNIAVITPTGTINEYPTPLPNPNPTGLTKTGPNNITAGPDGNLWFTEWDVNQVASITTTGTVNAYSLTGSNPWGITAGPDGNIWFTELNGNMIGKITPSGVLTEYPIPTASSTPAGITAGPDGNIWFTEWGADKIGVFSPSSPTLITEYTLPANTLPPGPPGTSNSGPQTITVGSDGNLWFTETNNDKIGKITPAGVITEYPIPAGSYPFAIVAGLDGNLWFTELHRNKVGRITPSGTLTEFAIDPDSLAVGITVGP
jgi:streptogramin lyase